MNEDYKQLLMILVVAVLASSAAFAGKWDIVTTCITGYFALLNMTRKRTADEIPAPVALTDKP